MRAGSKFFNAARNRCSLYRYFSANLRIYAWDRCSAGRNVRCAEAMAGAEVFSFVTFVLSFVSMIVLRKGK